MAAYYVDHNEAVYPVSAAGVPFTAAYIQSKGDPKADLCEDMAAEQKARSTYEYLLNLADDADVIEPLKFLREREIVYSQRFGKALRYVQEYLESKKHFIVPNPIQGNHRAYSGVQYQGVVRLSCFRDQATVVEKLRAKSRGQVI